MILLLLSTEDFHIKSNDQNNLEKKNRLKKNLKINKYIFNNLASCSLFGCINIVEHFLNILVNSENVFFSL